MNLNDIHMGDIAITKEGVRYKIINFYYTYRKRGEIRIENAEKFDLICNPLH